MVTGKPTRSATSVSAELRRLAAERRRIAADYRDLTADNKRISKRAGEENEQRDAADNAERLRTFLESLAGVTADCHDDAPLPDADRDSATVEHDVTEPRWIVCREVCALLGLGKTQVLNLVKEGKLSRVGGGRGKGACLYSQREVEELASRRARAGEDHPSCAQTWVWGDRRCRMPGENLITTREAGTILCVTAKTVVGLVRRGVLQAHQAKPLRKGSRLYLSKAMVLRLAWRPARMAYMERIGPDRKPARAALPGWQDREIEPYRPADSTGSAKTRHGDFYSARQAAIALGISSRSVRAMVKTGRLQGHHVRMHLRLAPNHMWRLEPRAPQQWRFLKEDVHELLEDPDYLACRARGMARVRKSRSTDVIPLPPHGLPSVDACPSPRPGDAGPPLDW